LGPIVKKNGPSHFNKDGETFNQSKKMGPMGPIILFRNILFFNTLALKNLNEDLNEDFHEDFHQVDSNSSLCLAHKFL